MCVDPSLYKLIEDQYSAFGSDMSYKVVMEVLRAFIRVMSLCTDDLREGLVLNTLAKAAEKVSISTSIFRDLNFDFEMCIILITVGNCVLWLRF